MIAAPSATKARAAAQASARPTWRVGDAFGTTSGLTAASTRAPDQVGADHTIGRCHTFDLTPQTFRKTFNQLDQSQHARRLAGSGVERSELTQGFQQRRNFLFGRRQDRRVELHRRGLGLACRNPAI